MSFNFLLLVWKWLGSHFQEVVGGRVGARVGTLAWMPARRMGPPWERGQWVVQ